MKIVVAIGGSILLKEYDCKRFQEYSRILKDLALEHELFVVGGGGNRQETTLEWFVTLVLEKRNVMTLESK